MTRTTDTSITTRLVAVFLVLLLGSNAWARDKTDVISMSNGDRVTGEIKQLEHGKLRLSTDSLGELSIEWNDIERLDSDFEFQFVNLRLKLSDRLLKIEEFQVHSGSISCRAANLT